MAWKDLIQRNLGWKIVSLILAAVVWLTLQSAAGKRFGFAQSLALIVPTREFIRHPVNLLTAKDDARRFRLDPSEVDIMVRGERLKLQNLSPKAIQAAVDVTRAPDSADFTAKVEVFGPPDVTIVQVSPAEVHVQRLQP
jgi:YbbR domain-containing protein